MKCISKIRMFKKRLKSSFIQYLFANFIRVNFLYLYFLLLLFNFHLELLLLASSSSTSLLLLVLLLYYVLFSCRYKHNYKSINRHKGAGLTSLLSRSTFILLIRSSCCFLTEVLSIARTSMLPSSSRRYLFTPTIVSVVGWGVGVIIEAVAIMKFSSQW